MQFGGTHKRYVVNRLAVETATAARIRPEKIAKWTGHRDDRVVSGSWPQQTPRQMFEVREMARAVSSLLAVMKLGSGRRYGERVGNQKPRGPNEDGETVRARRRRKLCLESKGTVIPTRTGQMSRMAESSESCSDGSRRSALIPAIVEDGQFSTRGSAIRRTCPVPGMAGRYSIGALA